MWRWRNILTEHKSWAGWRCSWQPTTPQQWSLKPSAPTRSYCSDWTGILSSPESGSHSARHRSPSYIWGVDGTKRNPVSESSHSSLIYTKHGASHKHTKWTDAVLTCTLAPEGPLCACSNHECSSPGGWRCRDPLWCLESWTCFRWWRMCTRG